jgi:hypothetical protein
MNPPMCELDGSCTNMIISKQRNLVKRIQNWNELHCFIELFPEVLVNSQLVPKAWWIVTYFLSIILQFLWKRRLKISQGTYHFWHYYYYYPHHHGSRVTFWNFLFLSEVNRPIWTGNQPIARPLRTYSQSVCGLRGGGNPLKPHTHKHASSGILTMVQTLEGA